jgi:TetR/AcrR family transcriptional repressor of nem operon
MLPLCGALSAERSALPKSMHPQLTHFFQLHLDWLGEVLEDGLTAGALRPEISVEQVALLLLSTLEGGAFVGWALQRKEPVLAAFEAALRNIEMSNSARRPARSTA